MKVLKITMALVDETQSDSASSSDTIANIKRSIEIPQNYYRNEYEWDFVEQKIKECLGAMKVAIVD